MDRVAGAESISALVHLQLVDQLARSVVHDADFAAGGRATARLGCRRRTRERHRLHLLDHGQEPDQSKPDVRGSLCDSQSLAEETICHGSSLSLRAAAKTCG